MIKNIFFIIFLIFALILIGALLLFAKFPKEQQIVFEQKKEESKEVVMIAVGDVSFSRGVEREILKEKDINFPFLEVSEYLNSADFVFANLESPITEGENISDLGMMFRAPLGTEKALKEANIQIVSLANNHTMNFGQKGLFDTFSLLTEQKIKYAGAGKNQEEAYSPAYFSKNGIKFAFLAYTDPSVIPVSYEAKGEREGVAFLDIKKMEKAVKEAKEKADLVVVSMHAGQEYVFKPIKSQQEFARKAIDAGADLVIGHHPHVVQTMENYKGKYIFYSLGNFVFDQRMKTTRESVAAKIFLDKQGVKRIEATPIVIENGIWQPRISDSQEIIQRLDFDVIKEKDYYLIFIDKK